MRLAKFILDNIEPILAEWITFAGSLESGAEMTTLALRDDAEAILRSAAHDMQVPQSLPQQASKSKGHGGAGGKQSDRLDEASALHGIGRVESGFDIMEIVSEYRALRATVLRLWRASRPDANLSDLDDITRFNELIDQSLATAVGSYTDRVDQSRNMFLAILGHDLRNPLHGIHVAALLISELQDQGNADITHALSRIKANSKEMARLISDLTDFASTWLGGAMPLTRERANLEALCHEVVGQCISAHPKRTVRFHAEGDLTGEWDAARLRQVVSNLLGNAIQHGSAEEAIELSVASEGSAVVLAVHSEGTPIPAHALTKIFEPLVRHDTVESATRRVPGSVGLGLYIVREIVSAHGGTVKVSSTAEEGTTFTVRLPVAPPT